ncbi:MAG: hypothetical protein E7346_07825 [Clostridiales bacterium]|nr:hypothetical protein [Clostridiales bacterium]
MKHKFFVKITAIILSLLTVLFSVGCVEKDPEIITKRSGIDPILLFGKEVDEYVFQSALDRVALTGTSGVTNFTVEKFSSVDKNATRGIDESYEIIKINDVNQRKVNDEMYNAICCEYVKFEKKKDGSENKSVIKKEAKAQYFTNTRGNIVVKDIYSWIGFCKSKDFQIKGEYKNYIYNHSVKGYININEEKDLHIIKIENNKVSCYIKDISYNLNKEINYDNAEFYIFYDYGNTVTENINRSDEKEKSILEKINDIMPESLK